ncbi:glycosyltransferase family 4 protein [Laspinema olomoucense]|uniref:glycosyltransferase family 4 protein n=1 Tax=Laspinema olomoucense TaxID=3231600 RepID=UPI0021BBB120|nr:glycosyltransferase family 4 protein [Laspinema sp. D3a]MCT7990056.1 glycosyltransferase family 4 protein [Laspinema sp. D3a]
MAPPEYKILHIQKVAGIAGSENHLLTLLPKLREYGYQPTMLVLADQEDRPSPFIEKMQATGVHTELVSIHHDADLILLWDLLRYFQCNCFDLIHTHLFHADIYGSTLTKITRNCPLVSTKHGFDPWRVKPLYAFLNRIAASQQQQIITVSKAIGEWLVKTEKLPVAKMRVIPNAIEIENIQPITKHTKELVNLSKPIIGTVSRLLHQKGVHVLLDAFAKCLGKHPQASLVIVGDGLYRHQLEKQVRLLGIAKNTHFLGYIQQPRLSAVFSEFDIFAFPTFGEGFGLVLLEAMAVSKPVVASNVMAIPEIVIDGQTGLLVPPDNADALAQGLLKLIENPSLCQQFGSAGRQRLEQEFTVDRMVQKTIAVYDEVLGISRDH